MVSDRCRIVKCPNVDRCVVNSEHCIVPYELESLKGMNIDDCYMVASHAGKCPKCGGDLLFIGDYDYDGKVFRKKSVESLGSDVDVLSAVFNCVKCGYRSRGYGVVGGMWEEFKR